MRTYLLGVWERGPGCRMTSWFTPNRKTHRSTVGGWYLPASWELGYAVCTDAHFVAPVGIFSACGLRTCGMPRASWSCELQSKKSERMVLYDDCCRMCSIAVYCNGRRHHEAAHFGIKSADACTRREDVLRLTSWTSKRRTQIRHERCFQSYVVDNSDACPTKQ